MRDGAAVAIVLVIIVGAVIMLVVGAAAVKVALMWALSVLF